MPRTTESTQPIERSRYQMREIRGGMTSKGRFRRGRFHIVLGVLTLSLFPTIALIERTGDRFTLIAGSIVMILVGMQQISRGIDELKLAQRRRAYERNQGLIDDKVFD